MYAAIEDPNNQGDLYTSGSETYAQIQPQESVTISVEINIPPSLPSAIATSTQPATSTFTNQPITVAPPTSTISNVSSPRHSVISEEPITQADILKVAHSRQASSSSCTSSVGNLGSPKPEKRQANSPLPPTPKNLFNTNLANANISGRNSAASVIEINITNASGTNTGETTKDGEQSVTRKNRLSKDLEGMYAKVMKKNKLSNAPSQSASPVPNRKSYNDNQTGFMSDPDIAREINLPDALSRSVHASPGKNSIKSANLSIENNYETIDKRRAKSSNANYDDSKDPGYETIPADKIASSAGNSKKNLISRASAPPGN